MIKTARGRILAVVLLLAGQAMLFPLYAQQPHNPEAGVYPVTEDFIHSPDSYIGEQVETGGIVQQTDPIVIDVETAGGTREVIITGTQLSPSKGDTLRVLGRLTGPQTVESITAFTVPQAGRWYTWGISFLAGLWVLSRFIRHWRVDLSDLGFERRDTPLSRAELVQLDSRQQGNDNA